jgi:16S rRNA processing protein RimM
MRIGRVGRPHGLDGSFHVVEPVADRLVEGAELDGLGAIVTRKGADSRPIVRLEGVDSREAADALRGRALDLLGVAPDALGEDEYAAADLEGCTVADGSRELGVVQRLMALPSCEALELDDGTLVPLVRDCIRGIDVEARRIDVDGGFLGAA